MGHDALNLYWTRLGSASRLRFHSRSGAGSNRDWHRYGSGQLERKMEAHQLVFKEYFQLNDGRFYQDCKRWTLLSEALRFEHWREERFLFLADLKPHGRDLCAHAPHFCGADVYDFRLSLWGSACRLHIRITGTHKNEALRYDYLP